MTIYLDYIFIENFFIYYILLKETSYVSRRISSEKRLIAAALIASSYVVVMMYLKIQELNYLISKVLLMVLMIYISFKPEKINEYIKLIALFFLISVINVGSLTVITNLFNLKSRTVLLKIVVYLISLLLSKLFTTHMWRLYRREIKNDDLIYDVKIILGNKKYMYKAFLDTGNSVYSNIYDVPVIFAELIDESMLKNLKDKVSFNVNTITLSNKQMKQAYIFEDIEIKKKNMMWHVKAGVVFEDIKLSKDYNMLLNYILYTDKMGGIKIWT